MNKERIGVFLSSRIDVNPAYIRATEEVGAWIGERGLTLCYGGSRSGLMEVLAERVKSHGGRCLGVVPTVIQERDLVSEHIDIEFPCVDLHDRKAILLREADVFLALPGGIGTLDEVMTLLGCITIGISRQRMILYNVEGCWDSLIALLQDHVDRNLAKHRLEELVAVAHSVDELAAIFDSLA